MFASNAFADLTAFFPASCSLCRVRGGRSHRLRLIHARHKYSGEYLRCRTCANGLRAVCQPAVAYPRRLEDATGSPIFFNPRRSTATTEAKPRHLHRPT